MKYSDKILIIEDENNIRRLFGIGASMNGIPADLAVNGLIADAFVVVNCVLGESYPVILTDLNMPMMNGLEFIANVKEKVGAGEILRPEIYVCSGYHEKWFDIVRELGSNRVFQKPTDIATLFRDIRQTYDLVRSGKKR
jgi:DNA-binding response OmpR family regulator